jgi:hypothetical protein
MNFEKPDGPETKQESPFSELREKTYAEMEVALKKRIKENPAPTDHELRIGAYEEEIEPQMREALQRLYEKGYNTESSGFGGGEKWETQQVDGYFEIDEATEKKLNEIGARVVRQYMEYLHATSTRIEFDPEQADAAAIVAKWNQIIDLLPTIGKPSYSLSAPSYEFREKFLGEEEARRIQIETAFEHGSMPDDEREQAAQWLKEHPRKTNP